MKPLHRPTVRSKPQFVIEDYFLGRTFAWGLFVDRFGRVRREFSVDITGEFDDGRLVLKEDFDFDDGERSQRHWLITPLGDGRYRGSADDVVGTANGEVKGNCLRWSYDLNLRIGPRLWRVHLDDVMLLQNDQILLNRASMTKYGVRLGEIMICFQKEVQTRENWPADVKITDTVTRRSVLLDRDLVSARSA